MLLSTVMPNGMRIKISENAPNELVEAFSKAFGRVVNLHNDFTYRVSEEWTKTISERDRKAKTDYSAGQNISFISRKIK